MVLPGLGLDYKGANSGKQRNIINAKMTLKHFSSEISRVSLEEIVLILLTPVDLLYTFTVHYFHANINRRQIIGAKSCSKKNIF